MTTFHVSTRGLPQLTTANDIDIPEAWVNDELLVVFYPADERTGGASVGIRNDSGGQLYCWCASDAEGSELQQLRDCFNEPRRRMRYHLILWRSFAYDAEDREHLTQGMRAHARKLSNRAKRRALAYASEWRAAKAIWRNLVSLRQGR